MSWIIEDDHLHITIGSSPRVDALAQKLDLHSELEMSKAALLYAERATLCSPTASVLSELENIADLPTDKAVKFFESVPSWFPDAELAQEARKIGQFYRRARSRRYSKKGQEDLLLFEKALKDSRPTFSAGLRDAIAKLGGDEILLASKSGFLEIHQFESPLERIILDSQRRPFVEEYVSVVGESVSNRSTYPLFDQETSSIIGSGIRAGFIPVSEFGIAHGKEVGLAADLFRRLPLFPRASVKEILDIRQNSSRH